ncbi:MAG: beta-ketoacyl-ACP synthase 3 [Solirubrobacteraceae bacterium]|jgi:3-oxoacyl-[acyl-carrier-protein] synthase-3
MPEAVVLAPAAPVTEERPAPRSLGPTRAPVRPAAILSVATELPEGVLSNAELAVGLGVTEEWILSRTGIRERRRAGPGERLSDYATRAGAKALAAAGVPAVDIDLVIVATVSADELTPNAAPIVAHNLGAVRAGAYDVGAACTAFLTALAQGAAQIESHRAEHVLVIGADFITRIVDYQDKRSAPLFADAAGAVVLGAGDPQRGSIGPVVLGADGSQAGTLFVSVTERKIRMDGPEVFRHAVRRMSEVTREAVLRAGLTLDEIDLFVYHQANARITRALGERLGLDPGRVVECIETIGNASAAMLPVGLATALADGRLRPGSLVLLSAFGAGFVWGGAVIQWGGAAGG